MSVSKQCAILGLPRSTYYYKPIPESALNRKLMKLIDVQYLETPFYGSRRMTQVLRQQGHEVNRKRVARLMRKLALVAMVPRPGTSTSHKQHKKYPYLLRNLDIDRCNQVWAADITYIPVGEGYLYLVAVLDWYSRFILSWKLSNSLESDFCIDALQEAFTQGHPTIFNTDQGTQFTSHRFTNELNARSIKISMDGKGHYWDNIIVERLWRTIKYEEVYAQGYQTGEEAYERIASYTDFYNHKRPHQALDYRVPAEVFQEGAS